MVQQLWYNLCMAKQMFEYNNSIIRIINNNTAIVYDYE